MKAAAAIGGVLLPVLALIVGLAAIGGVATPIASALAPEVCVTDGPIRGLSTVAASNARIVVAAAQRMGGSAGAEIAVMVGYTESGLRILGNPTVNVGSVPSQGSGTNEDSLGIFQQRASWGSAAQRLDPVISTNLFVARLIAISAWLKKAPWVAAQEVQRSAYDGRPRPANNESSVFGGNYKANFQLARRVAGTIESDASRRQCGALTGGMPANPAPGSHGLPDGYSVPIGTSKRQARVVVFAIEQLDKAYVFGASGPRAYDCSGLTMAAWATVGVTLPHRAQEQALSGTPTSVDLLVPGDLVLVPGDDGTLASPGHVGLYIGHGLVLNAADERDGIRVQTYANFIEVGHGLAALRHIA